MSGSVVVDASLAAKWLVNETDSDKAHALARSWVETDTQPVAPYLMPVEVANVLYRRAVMGQILIETATRLLNGLLASGIEMLEPPELHTRALHLADQLQQGAVYDAHYLALAELLDCDLWTADESFQRAARASFPRVKWLGEFQA